MKQPHIMLDETLDARYAILPGDPARLDQIVPFLENVKVEGFNREYRSITGCYKGLKILGMSTGMGGVSAAIGIEELKRIGVEAAIRIGSCGALQPDISVGDIIISAGCVRDDGTSNCYVKAGYPAVPDTDMLQACLRAAEGLDATCHVGITRSHESFYAEAENQLEPYWQQQGILADDMETAAIFVVGRLRALKCAAVLNTVVALRGDKASGIGAYADGADAAAAGERAEILLALETLRIYDEIYRCHCK